MLQSVKWQVLAADDGPARRAASRPQCCTKKVDAQCDKLATVVLS